jgi:N,N'-diacetyllegionaminate synthase
MVGNELPELMIGDRALGAGHPLFFIAEAGVNHNGNIEYAHQMIDVASEAGADAIKFQTFSAEKLNIPNAPKAAYHIRTTGSDADQSWFDLLKSQELSPDDHVALMNHCREREIIFLSTPYDHQSVDLLSELGVAAFKVASTDANNVPLLKHIAAQGKPVVYSTGMCEWTEVIEGVTTLREAGCAAPVVMQCTSEYPTISADLHLRVIERYRDHLGVLTGFSDHSAEEIPIALILSIGLGACAYEKHFTLDRNLPGPDHAASSTPEELRAMVRAARLAELSLGSSQKTCLDCEQENRRKLRKSIVAATAIAAGTKIAAEMLDCKRPGFGLAPGHLDELIGKIAAVDIAVDSLIERAMLQ